MNFDATKNMAGKKIAWLAVQAAHKHAVASKNPSDLLCKDAAKDFFLAEKYGFAHEWSTRSLEYSVGILSIDYGDRIRERLLWGQVR